MTRYVNTAFAIGLSIWIVGWFVDETFHLGFDKQRESIAVAIDRAQAEQLRRLILDQAVRRADCPCLAERY
jgi:hypothetical protein